MSPEETQFNFLGTMAGDQVYLQGINKEPTYARIYKSFGGSNHLRKEISERGCLIPGPNYQDIGNSYSYTPFWRRTPFSSRPSSMQGGGFFLTVKTFEKEEQERSLNCFAYAIGTFGNNLEKLSEKNMRELQASVIYTIDHIVDRYFTNVAIPEEGDLAVYSVSPGEYAFTPSGRPVSGTTHAGVYRNSQHNWNSPSGGTIESKWGPLLNPYVFQHDIFFLPDFYGNQVKFYRIKNSPYAN